MPFFKGITGNVKQVFMHGGKCEEWQLIEPEKLRET